MSDTNCDRKRFVETLELVSAVGAVVAIFTAESTLVNRQHGAVKQKQLIFMVIV